MSVPIQPTQPGIGAVVLAAGLSRRMGQPKMLLPWGERTVIEQVVTQLIQAGVAEICVVTGGACEQVEESLRRYPVRLAFNPRYEDGEMLHSLQVGLEKLPATCTAALMVLGDQPQIQSTVIYTVIQVYRQRRDPLVIPSYQMRRGHPWMIDRALWPEVLGLHPPITLRDFLSQHAAQIHYVNLDEPSILADMDTPEDYQRLKPG